MEKQRENNLRILRKKVELMSVKPKIYALNDDISAKFEKLEGLKSFEDVKYGYITRWQDFSK